MHAETAQTAEWWARPRGPEQQAWIENYRQSLQGRHRTTIVEIVKALKPKTLLEVGCHCGPNLVRLAGELPKLQMIGLDVNTEAIQAGRAWVSTEKLASRIQLNVGRVPEATQALPTGMCDVVLSCYTLAYVAPTDLDAVLYELGRLATRAVILAEPMRSGKATESRSFSGYIEWAHDYQAASQWVGTLSGRPTRIVAVEPPVDRLNGIFVAGA
jgi:ubiquinone/menaquinone biosynthesis C-methylase UbiE